MTVIEHEHAFALFGTRVRVLVAAPAADPLQARIAAIGVHAALRRMHHTLTRFDAGSELSQLNRRAGETVVASPTLRRAVTAALRAAAFSGGLVDPTLLPELERAGYATSRAGREPADLTTALATAPARRGARARPGSGWQAITVDDEAGTVRIPAGIRLDLGGTAKGLAVDTAAGLLAAAPRYAVDAGGDIRAGGTAATARAIDIEHPLTGETALTLMLNEGAVATSGLRTRLWPTASGHAHHLIDPASGTPAWSGVIQATACAPTTLQAETLAKTALLLGPEPGRTLLEEHGGLLILDDGTLRPAGPLPVREIVSDPVPAG